MDRKARNALERACEPVDASCGHRQRCIQARWLLGAALFGAVFPAVGWLVALADPAVSNVASAHRSQPVLYIVDLAPFVLGFTGYVIGYFHARLLKIRHAIERTVRARTAELEQALADLSESQAGKDRLVASVSHELRTPLTSIVGLAHTLLESSEEMAAAERNELLGLLASESKETAAIVDDLLVAARIERGQLSVAADCLQLDEALCSTITACGVEVRPLRIEPVQVIGDAVRVRQILRNFITNAQRYGGEAIGVEIYADGDAAVLAVRDNGAGVPEARLDQIFAPFGTAHNDPGRTESVGLGLTVSRDLARLMGGDVVYRRRDGWTSFELHLPLANEAQEDSTEALLGPHSAVEHSMTA